MKKQPAKTSYWFRKAYLDVFNTIKNSFLDNIDVIQDCFERLKDSFSPFDFFSIFKIILYPFIILFLILFGFTFTIIFSLIHILLVMTVMSFVYLGFMLLWFVDFLYRSVHKISYNCESCQKKYKMPTYACPKCGALHTHLVPSKYGIFTRTCNCGEKLPTTFLNGRQNLPSYCPNCKEPLKNAVQTSYIIPVIGGANCGKTCFINSGIQMVEDKASSFGLSFDYVDTNGEYSKNKQMMSQGYVPQKTADMDKMKFYNFYLNKPNAKVKKFISICDVAGEAFQREDAAMNLRALYSSDAMFIILDPFSCEDFHDQAKQEMGDEYDKVNASSDTIDSVVNTANNALEKITTQSKKKLFCSVIFVKTDIPFVDKIIGETAIKEKMSQNTELDYMKASNEVAKDFFEQYNLNSTYLALKSMFSEVQFFSVSALGKDQQENKAFNPISTDKPIYWVLNKVAKLDLEKAILA